MSEEHPLVDLRGWGVPGMRSPPGGANSFIFMQFSAKKFQNNPNLEVGEPPGENPGSTTDTGDLIIASVQPGNTVESGLDVIVFILVFNAGHRWFTCHRCPNLNLRQLSESESEANSTHFTSVVLY